MREISDPCSLILNQLHKILFISQLPPSGHADAELSNSRHVIERYKRELFSHRNQYRGRNLKDELHKVMSGSQEMIDLVAFRSAASADGLGGGASSQQRISYEELQRSIEHVLEATGYYALLPEEQPQQVQLQQQAMMAQQQQQAPPPPVPPPPLQSQLQPAVAAAAEAPAALAPPGIERAASLPVGLLPRAAAPSALPPVRPPAAPSRDLPLAS